METESESAELIEEVLKELVMEQYYLNVYLLLVLGLGDRQCSSLAS